jgi:hypothetical protein
VWERGKRAEIRSSRRCLMHNNGGPTTVLQSLSLGLNSTVIVSLNLVLCLSSISILSLSHMTCKDDESVKVRSGVYERMEISGRRDDVMIGDVACRT